MSTDLTDLLHVDVAGRGVEAGRHVAGDHGVGLVLCHGLGQEGVRHSREPEEM